MNTYEPPAPPPPYTDPESARYSAFNARSLRVALGLLTDDEVGAAIGVTTQTLAGWRSNGEGPVYTKLGKSVFYRSTDLSAWIAANTIVPSPKGVPATE